MYDEEKSAVLPFMMKPDINVKTPYKSCCIVSYYLSNLLMGSYLSIYLSVDHKRALRPPNYEGKKFHKKMIILTNIAVASRRDRPIASGCSRSTFLVVRNCTFHFQITIHHH
ncbi:hypothetical protein MtrunA17_Chr5g0411551 [Medicago truncatula]|uniref:Uncharacterized protein n=1 Tax=Medicago truncatula TaxID=3880 RepID=G7KF63_MEDTR|nr:hypothetical protein MTR_5g030800 [Medicago truncatula]RHN54868.1 hypothetical protein MtrunA17_Chr5g0411551 [Medicago truncatula]